jgi:uncharacterized protein YjbI with pentapeptide repeats
MTSSESIAQCGRSHEPAPPQIGNAEPAAALIGDCDDLDRPELVDVRLDDCDVSGVIASDFIARRLELRRTRLRGVTFAGGQVDDGLIEDCSTSELSLRFSRLRRVVFRNCDLSAADFTSTTFDHVTIEGCDLQRARFDAATVNCLAVMNCTLTGITGVGGLKGAQLDASDLPNLAQSLAAETGILIRDA